MIFLHACATCSELPSKLSYYVNIEKAWCVQFPTPQIVMFYRLIFPSYSLFLSCLSFTVSLCLFLALILSLYLSLCLSLSLSFPLSFCLSFCKCLSVCLSRLPTLPICLSRAHSLSLSLPLSLSPSLVVYPVIISWAVWILWKSVVCCWVTYCHMYIQGVPSLVGKYINWTQYMEQIRYIYIYIFSTFQLFNFTQSTFICVPESCCSIQQHGTHWRSYVWFFETSNVLK